MKKLICLSILLNSLLVGCASSDKAENMLENRAEYFKDVEDLSLENHKNKPKRKAKSFTVYAWRHKSVLPNGDRFLGGWLELEIK